MALVTRPEDGVESGQGKNKVENGSKSSALKGSFDRRRVGRHQRQGGSSISVKKVSLGP